MKITINLHSTESGLNGARTPATTIRAKKKNRLYIHSPMSHVAAYGMTCSAAQSSNGNRTFSQCIPKNGKFDTECCRWMYKKWKRKKCSNIITRQSAKNEQENKNESRKENLRHEHAAARCLHEFLGILMLNELYVFSNKWRIDQKIYFLSSLFSVGTFVSLVSLSGRTKKSLGMGVDVEYILLTIC